MTAETPEPTPRRAALLPLLVPLAATIAIFALPWVDTIRWYGSGIVSSIAGKRSLVTHAMWWLDAPFGPWYGPLVAVAAPPLLVALAIVVPPRPKKHLAILAVIAAWAAYGAALVGLGEDIVFTWLRMPAPLLAQAGLVTLWWATRRWWIVPPK